MTLPAAGPEISQFVAGAIKAWGIELRTEQSVQAIDATRTLCKVKEMEREAAEMRRADAIHDHGLHPPLDDTT